MSILFDEFSLSGLRLKNRFIRSATWEVRATPEGRCTEELPHFLEAIAQGGVGLIIMGNAYEGIGLWCERARRKKNP